MGEKIPLKVLNKWGDKSKLKFRFKGESSESSEFPPFKITPPEINFKEKEVLF
jgi:hypothetical protein